MVALPDQPYRLETSRALGEDSVFQFGAWRPRIVRWLTQEAFPLWSRAGIDGKQAGFHDALSMRGRSLAVPKRMRTIARQVYAFAVASHHGWSVEALEAMSAGLEFIELHGRTASGGWVRTFGCDGAVSDETEDLYDTACVLLALAHAHRCGDRRALRLGRETFEFLDRYLLDVRHGGYLETSHGGTPRRSNPHMHLLEACLAWHEVTAEASYLERADGIVALFRRCFFDAENWAVREYFADDWAPAGGEVGERLEPGHHFEWASLLVEFAFRSGQTELLRQARKLYASAMAGGVNRATGLAFAVISRDGRPIDTMSRSWQQSEAVRAAIAIDRTAGADMKPEIEARVARLFRWHISPAPSGLWIDRIDARGIPISTDVPASILYHLTSAFTEYLQYAEQQGADPTSDEVPAGAALASGQGGDAMNNGEVVAG